LKKFALIGASGYVAPKHLKAIQDNKGDLVSAYDPFDSAGVLDQFFPQADFFTKFERFDRHIDKLRRLGKAIDYLSVCSPNYLHDAHCRFALKNSADVICEKPLVLNPWNIDGLRHLEDETGQKVYSILQLRLHPAIVALKKQIEESTKEELYEIDLTYITARGKWYYASWKGDNEKSGGIATNIGIHFFDMLTWIFGEIEKSIVHLHRHDRASGVLLFKNARVKWFLSINEDTLPNEMKKAGQSTYRHLTIDGQSIDFTEGFDNLHSKSYEAILNGNGFAIDDAIPAIQIVHNIRNAKLTPLKGEYHPFAKKPLSIHPFQMK
jgi:UDP-N-acetyl-2-amino-2-deoxyglucuronate dehydrogenase